MQTGCSEREGRRRLIDSSSSSSKEDNALFKPPFLLSLFLPLFFPSGGAPSVFLSPRARATSRKPKHSTSTLFGQISLSLSSLSNSSQKCPKLSNSTLQKNLKKTLFPADPQVHGPRRGHEALCAHLGALLRQGALGKGPVGEWRGSGMKSH